MNNIINVDSLWRRFDLLVFILETLVSTKKS